MPTATTPPFPAPPRAEASAVPCLADGARWDPGSVCLEPAWPALVFDRAVWFGVAPGDPQHAYVIEQEGIVRVFGTGADASTAPVFADLTDRVRSQATEEGLLSLAFHPKYAQNRRVFLYSSRSGPRRTVLAEYAVIGGSPGRLDPSSERIVLEISQPYGNHNGGDVVFGPDGLLYLSIGDGGSGGDPHGNGQNTQSLLGTIVRIDVDGATPYAIPSDNPFADGRDGRPEIYAWGLRNPWRIRFDPVTGQLWAADVGQNAFEEVDVVRRGGNYGWNLREAESCFASEGCDTPGLIDPVWSYDRREGISITGGHTYRGEALPRLAGSYVVGDFGTRKLWAVCSDGRRAAVARELGVAPAPISSFGVDHEGETIVVGFGRKEGLGRLVPCPVSP